MDLWLHGSSDAGACGHANQYFELSLDTASVRSRSWCVSFTAFLCAPDGKWQCSRIRDSATGSRRTVIRVRRWRAEEKSEIRGREQNGFRVPSVLLFGGAKRCIHHKKKSQDQHLFKKIRAQRVLALRRCQTDAAKHASQQHRATPPAARHRCDSRCDSSR